MRELLELQDLGYTVQLDGDDIVCQWRGPGAPDARAVPKLLGEVKRHKKEAILWLQRCDGLPAQVEDWPRSWRDVLFHRSSVIKATGVDAIEADATANTLVRRSYSRKYGPDRHVAQPDRKRDERQSS